MEKSTHVAILPSLGMGHLIPIIALAKQLHHHHHFLVTLIIPTTGPPPKAQLEALQALPKGINHVFLSPVTLNDLPEDTDPLAKAFITMNRSLSPLRDTLKSLVATTNLAALVVSPFGTEAIDVAKEFHVSPYLFFTSPAMALSFLIHLPKLDEMVQGDYSDLTEPVQVPGCIPIQPSDLMEPLRDRSSVTYKLLVHTSKLYTSGEGIIVHSFVDLEPGPIKALQAEAEEPGMPRLYPIGPYIQTVPNNKSENRSDCLKYLDNQPSGSVLYVSFGSGGTLSSKQLNELAYGLEISGKRFLWVVRSPNDKFSNAALLGSQTQNGPSNFLPEGFLERTTEQGIVVPSWAPQIEVLSHGSTGGFLTHCGWNSTLESVVNGVPLIAWPLYAEQRMNAAMLTEGHKVALRPKVNQNGIVEREEIAKVVRDLMEGEKGKMASKRMKKLKDAAAKALSEDGTSMKSLSELALKWKNKKYLGS